MTENEIKEMLNDIINNGAEYECRFIAGLNPHTWKPYKLGEGINEFYEYRKVEKWYVFCYGNNDYIIIKDVTSCGKPCVFEGTKKECEKWVEEHTAEEIAEVIQDFFPDTDLDLLATAIQSYKDIDAWSSTPVLEKEAFERLQDVIEEAGELSKRADYSKVVNNKYAKEAIK